jgi:predicted enzyme related to lactoylglutathione lyase
MTISTPLVNHVDFVTIFVDDFEKAVEFYGTVLGLEPGPRYGQIDGREFETGNLTLSVMRAGAIGLEFERSGHPIALQVDDVAAAREQLEAQGVEFQGDVIDSGVCQMAPFRDPAGNALMLHHRYAPRD